MSKYRGIIISQFPLQHGYASRLHYHAKRGTFTACVIHAGCYVRDTDLKLSPEAARESYEYAKDNNGRTYRPFPDLERIS